MTNSPTEIELAYVVDTNALIWYLTTNKKLSKRASNIFAAAERGETRLYISAIVIAEMYFADKKWKLFDDFPQIYLELKAKPYIRLVPFVADDALKFERNIVVPEMHDSIIVGVAQRLAAPLITSDSVIHATQLVTIAW